MSLLSALLQNESGNRNINNTTQTTTSGQAQGNFQITSGTWADFAPKAGVSLSQFPTADSAPWETQAQVAATIPLQRWDSSTLAAIRGAGYNIDPTQTLGQNVANAGETMTNPNSSSIDPNAAHFGNNDAFNTTAGDQGMLGGFNADAGTSGINSSTSPFGGLNGQNVGLDSFGSQDPSTAGFSPETGGFSNSDFSNPNGSTGTGTGDGTGGASGTGTGATDSAGNPMGAGDIVVSKAAPIGSGGSAGGNPVNIVADAPAVADTASTNATNTAIGSAANATSTSITGSIETFTQSLFIRAMLIILGLVLLAVGVWSLFPKTVQTVARNAAAAA